MVMLARHIYFRCSFNTQNHAMKPIGTTVILISEMSKQT